MRELLSDLLSRCKTAILQMWEYGKKSHDLLPECKRASASISNALWHESEKALADARGIFEKRDVIEADRAAVYEGISETIAHVRHDAVELLEKQIETDPAKVDGVVMELLKQGMYSDSELRKEAERFRDNPTMLRLIGKYAARRESDDMRALAAEIERTRGSRIIEAVDELCNVCDRAMRRVRAWRADGPTADSQIETFEAAADPVADKVIQLYNDWIGGKCQI